MTSVKTNLVATDEGDDGGYWPVVLGAVQVSVADTSGDELDETFARLEVLGLDDGVILADFEGSAVCWDDGSCLCLWDGELRHDLGAREVFVSWRGGKAEG